MPAEAPPAVVDPVMIYYASFIPGLQEIIASVLSERLDDAKIIFMFEGAVVFETSCSYDKLNFFCFNNVFAVIDTQENDNSFSASSAPEAHIKKIIFLLKTEKAGRVSVINISLLKTSAKSIKTFRLICSVENKPASINEKIKQEMEKILAGYSGLEVDRRGGDTEFWFLSRREGFSFFMKRLSPNDKKNVRAGELSPQLAWTLCRIAGLKHGETAADPFCGYGSIAGAACKHFHIDKFFASDIDSRCIEITHARRELKGSKRADIFQSDFRKVMSLIREETVDAIITDPPWGMFKEAAIPLVDFYREMCAVFARLLKVNGRAVILTAAKSELENAAASSSFEINKTTPILVSGKKAAIYELQ